MYRACSLVTFYLVAFQVSHQNDILAQVNPKQEPTDSSTPSKTALTNDNKSETSTGLQSKLGEIILSDLSNSSISNSSSGSHGYANGVLHRFGLDTGAVKRTFYVVAALTGIVLLFFTFKGIRTMRRKRRKPRRYGLLADTKEMKQFRDEEEDESDVGDEDATLFDARKHKPTSKRGGP